MTPEVLAKQFPRYREFRPAVDNPLFYTKNGQLLQIGRARQLVIAFMGPSAVGKDAILVNLKPDVQEAIVRIRTTTTRPTRSNGSAIKEVYSFADERVFRNMAHGGQFIEWIPQFGGLYGTPKQAVEDALGSHKPLIIWRGEIRGWPKVKQWVEEQKLDMATYSIFVLPAMPIAEYGTRLAQKRGLVDALKNRIPKALSEIAQAPAVSDALLLNPPDESGIPRQAIEATEQLFMYLINSLSSPDNRP